MIGVAGGGFHGLRGMDVHGRAKAEDALLPVIRRRPGAPIRCRREHDGLPPGECAATPAVAGEIRTEERPRLIDFSRGRDE
jgi:hypothetical protein